MNLPNLPKDAFVRGRAFIERRGRELDRARLALAVCASDANPVLEALGTFQNTDGGFGHAIEPDLRCDSSTALATSVGLQVLRDVNAPAANPMVKRAIAWTLAALDRERFVWPIITPEAAAGVHAPWWNWVDDMEASWNFYRYNPSADLFAALCQWRTLVPETLFTDFTNDFLWRLKNNPPAQIYDLYCCLRLANAKSVPQNLREPLSKAAIAAAETQDPDSFHVNYFELVPSANALLYPVLKKHLARAIERARETQGEDGGWYPPWSWEEIDEKAWAIAEREWAGVLTRQTLETVHRFGLLG
jgi:hypothetical protein